MKLLDLLNESINENNFPSPQRGNRYSKKELRQMTGSIPKNLKWKTWYGDQAWRNSTNEYYRVKGDNDLMIKWLNDKIKDHKQSIEFDDYRDFKGDGLEMDREYIKGYTAFLTLLTGGWQGSLFEESSSSWYGGFEIKLAKELNIEVRDLELEQVHPNLIKVKADFSQEGLDAFPRAVNSLLRTDEFKGKMIFIKDEDIENKIIEKHPELEDYISDQMSFWIYVR